MFRCGGSRAAPERCHRRWVRMATSTTRRPMRRQRRAAHQTCSGVPLDLPLTGRTPAPVHLQSFRYGDCAQPANPQTCSIGPRPSALYHRPRPAGLVIVSRWDLPPDPSPADRWFQRNLRSIQLGLVILGVVLLVVSIWLQTLHFVPLAVLAWANIWILGRSAARQRRQWRQHGFEV